MARFAALRPGFVWSLNTVITGAELARFDEAQNKALSETGGTWTPTEDIIVAGATFGLYSHTFKAGDVGGGTPAFTVSGTALATNAASTLTAAGAAALNGATTIANATALGAAATGINLTGAGYPTRASTAVNNRGIRHTAYAQSSLWAPSSTEPGWLFSQSLAAPAWWELHLSAVGTLTRLLITVQGGSGHAALPAVLPVFSLWEVDRGTKVQLGTDVTDVPGPATVGQYETNRQVDILTVAPFRPNVNRRYFVRVISESGGNALTGYLVKCFEINTTIDRFGSSETPGHGV
jgi:hypothetical protein